MSAGISICDAPHNRLDLPGTDARAGSLHDKHIPSDKRAGRDILPGRNTASRDKADLPFGLTEVESTAAQGDLRLPHQPDVLGELLGGLAEGMVRA